MFIILSTLNQLNVEIRSTHRIPQLILFLDNILCPTCFKQQNIHLKLCLLWCITSRATKLSQDILTFPFQPAPQKVIILTPLCVPLPFSSPKIIPTEHAHQFLHHHLYFLPFYFEFTASSQISLGIASLRAFLTPKHHNQGQEN